MSWVMSPTLNWTLEKKNNDGRWNYFLKVVDFESRENIE